MKILNKWTFKVIFENQKETLKETVEDANLIGANLEGANLEDANLEDANLEGANLRGANLRGANLIGANLRGANLSGANLRGANLEDANLIDANLIGANGNLRELKTMQIETYSISFTKDILQIGCKRFSHTEWENFSDDEINKMDKQALSFWNKWKNFIFKAIELSFKKD
jgi:uncharacterized protein YjbI with pentapeptide repeats